jgi:hypothetical protein
MQFPVQSTRVFHASRRSRHVVSYAYQYGYERLWLDLVEPSLLPSVFVFLSLALHLVHKSSGSNKPLGAPRLLFFLVSFLGDFDASISIPVFVLCSCCHVFSSSSYKTTAAQQSPRHNTKPTRRRRTEMGKPYTASTDIIDMKLPVDRPKKKCTPERKWALSEGRDENKDSTQFEPITKNVTFGNNPCESPSYSVE